MNTNFEAQIKQLRSKISEKKETLQELSSGGGIQKLKQSDLKKKIIQLQRQKNNLESKYQALPENSFFSRRQSPMHVNKVGLLHGGF